MEKINDIRVLAEETASDVASFPRDWLAYRNTAAKLYRYPFADNLLIHTQHPQATETWNEKMVRRAKGIVLTDDTGPRQSICTISEICERSSSLSGKRRISMAGAQSFYHAE